MITSARFIENPSRLEQLSYKISKLPEIHIPELWSVIHGKKPMPVDEIEIDLASLSPNKIKPVHKFLRSVQLKKLAEDSDSGTSLQAKAETLSDNNSDD
jgi:hypothetical protein